MSATEATPVPPAVKPTPPSDVLLRAGTELTTSELDVLAREHPATLVVLIGPPDAGKTTLVATLYEQFCRAKVPEFGLAGSHSLVALERRCHLSRMASKLEQPETERSKSSDEELFYHLFVVRPYDPARKDHLFLLDVAGEGYQELRTSAAACRGITSLMRTDFLVLLIDGDKLAKPGQRYLALEQAINIIQCVWDSGAVAPICRLQVVMTKADKLSAAERKTVGTELRATIDARIGIRFPSREFAEIAARPDDPHVLPTGHGLASLFRRWLDRVGELNSSESVITPVTGERESEAFAHRRVAEPTA